MASASKTVNLTSNNGYVYPLTVSFVENSTSVENNTSNITCTGTLSAPNAYWSSSYNSTLTVYWKDNKQNTDIYIASVNAKTIALGGSISASGTINVTHKDDGTLSGYAWAKWEKGGTSAFTPNNGQVVIDWTALTTIARASKPTISPSPFNIGDTITINMNRKSTLFTHTVTLYFGNYSYQIATGVTDNCTLNTSSIASNMYQQIPNAASGQGNITVATYNGSTLVGTEQCLFTAKVTNSNPTFNSAYKDTNSTTTAITGDNQLIIQNNSTLQVNITNASAKNYASLSSVSVTIAGQTTTQSISSATLNIDLGTINLSSDTQMVVKLTDSRGISSSQTLTLQMLEWSLPTAIITLARENNFYTETNINVNADYSSLDSKNTITIKYRYKKVSDSDYSQYYTLQDNVSSTFNADNTYEWNVQVLLQDKLGTTTYNLTLNKGIPIAFFDRLKRSVGIDCFPSDEGSLEVDGENILTRIEGFGEICMSAPTTDWNTACGTRSGFYMGSDMSNSPSGATVANWWWVIHLAHNENYQRQIAFSFLNNENVYTRIMNNGTWNSWTLLNGTSAKTTDANGWTKIEHATYIEYFKKGEWTNSFVASGWARQFLTPLPSGMSSLGTNILTSSVTPTDAAINCSIGASPSDGGISVQWQNAYGGTVPATLYYDLRIIQFK